MKRDVLEPNRYEYLSKELSDLYDRADSLTREEAIVLVKRFIVERQEITRGSQRNSTY